MGTLNTIDEAPLRLGAFLGIFVALALLELAIPRRDTGPSKGSRWFTNLMIAGIDSLVMRLMAMLAVPIAAVAAAVWAQSQGWGLANQLEWPHWLEIAAAMILLDMAIYGQHVASHKIPLLWRLHKVHHTDVNFDVTTAIRFHPIEIALSMLWKIAVILALGAPPLAVVLFEVTLNGCAMFNHANIRLPLWLDRIVRLLVVTPDMHRVHHSVYVQEFNRNYGFSLSVWDRLFRTYTDQPRDGHRNMTIGLKNYQSDGPTRLGWSLRLPFMKTRKPHARSAKKAD
ncbi:fatty acid hydroxylase superfamily protein [bacterium BMS3Bbin10]|nr:fatty acid hydroxylase superfamily protein [bacterium BMS3Bbin10]